MMRGNMAQLSIIIPTLNEEKLIAARNVGVADS